MMSSYEIIIYEKKSMGEFHGKVVLEFVVNLKGKIGDTLDIFEKIKRVLTDTQILTKSEEGDNYAERDGAEVAGER